jgi:fatty-acid peroxygenase
LRLPSREFVVFAGRALHEHPGWGMRIAAGDREALSVFVHEVRRLYPFVPVLAAARAIVRTSSASPYRAEGLVVLDVHGTGHDPAHWPDPDHFGPS